MSFDWFFDYLIISVNKSYYTPIPFSNFAKFYYYLLAWVLYYFFSFDEHYF